MTMQDLSGKIAIITGASRGIGAETARLFAENGIKLALLARSAGQIGALAEDISASGGEALAIPVDVAAFDAVEKAVRTVIDHFGSIDILVNNAATIDPIARLADSPPDQWARAIDINLKGVFNGMRAALPHMVSQGAGTIVNLSSGAATSALEGWSHYCATKAAVLALTRCADKEYAPLGIRVVGLSPGTVATEMQKIIRASGINPVSQLDPSAHIPPRWAAQAIAWLCTSKGEAYAGTDFSLKTEENRTLVGLGASGI